MIVIILLDWSPSESRDTVLLHRDKDTLGFDHPKIEKEHDMQIMEHV